MTNKRSLLFFASITFLSLIIASCRSAKYLDDNQYLVTDVDLNGVTPELKEPAGMYVANEIRPNSPLYLTIYNMFNTRDGQYKTENIKNVGEAPRILDSAVVDLSATQIQRFLQTKGYFNAKVEPQIEFNKKKAKINFNANLGNPYTIREIDRTVEDPAVDSIYQEKVVPISPLKSGKRYDASDLYLERERLYTNMRESGYYDYLRQYMRAGIDTIDLDNQADLLIQVSNREDSTKHKIYYIDSVYFTVEAADPELKKNSEGKFDTLTKIFYTDQTGNFKLRPLSRYAFLRSGQKFNSANEELAYDRLYEMNGFRSVKINYQQKDSNKLDVQYTVVPRSAMSNQIEGEFTFSSGMSGFNVGNLLTSECVRRF